MNTILMHFGVGLVTWNRRIDPTHHAVSATRARECRRRYSAAVPTVTRSRIRMAGVGLMVAVLAVIVAACDGGTASDAATANSQQAQVFAYDDAYSPDVVEIAVGGEIEWRVEGDNPHNVFASDGSWESELVMDKGARYSRSFDEPGVYSYFCTFHGTPEGEGMAGYVIVGDVQEYERPTPTEDDVVEVWSGDTRNVPADYATIQQAVDASNPGDLILVAPGVYNEAVIARVPSLTIRGSDRNEVILDGGFELSNGIHAVADGVAVENMTARNYKTNGFYWTGVTGYRGSYLTAHNNGDYGIYAFDSIDGRLDHSYAEGNRDSGFYIGQCFPCNAVVENVTSVANGLGWSGTNAGGNLYLINSEWRDNMGGVVPNSLDSELLPPQREIYIGGNLIIDNNNGDAPTKGLAPLAWGEGVVLGGGVGNLVEKNLVLNHKRFGIVASVLPDKNIWWAEGNVVVDNTVAGSGMADLALFGPWAPNNCFEGNRYTSETKPLFLELFHSCSGINLPVVWDIYGPLLLIGATADANYDFPPGSDYREWPPPPPQASMPDAGITPVPAVNVFEKPDLSAIETPVVPDGIEIRGKEITVSGIPVSDPTIWTVIASMWAYFLPLALVGSWIALAVWDMVRRQEDMSRGLVILWFFVILLVPILGVIAYFVFGKSLIPPWMRWLVVGGGIAAWLIVMVALLVFSGSV
jgi:plastocyanin